MLLSETDPPESRTYDLFVRSITNLEAARRLPARIRVTEILEIMEVRALSLHKAVVRVFLSIPVEFQIMHRRLAVGLSIRSGISEKTCASYFLVMKILVAEDDQDSRELLTWMLEKLEYQVVATENGKQAWEVFRRGRFRLVISDVLMPEVDGLELCRRIRKHKQSKCTYVIIITALIGKKDYLEGMEAGADDFVTKPFDADELKARLRVAERIISFQEAAAAEEVG